MSPTTGIVTENEAPLGAVFSGSSDVGTAPHGVCVAFDDDTLEPTPTWVRIDNPAGTNVVNGWSIDRGRQGELDKTKTGTASASLIDATGVIDPTNAGGTYYGKIDPMKQAAIGLQNPVTGQWSTIYRGFSDWSFDIDVSEKFLTGTLDMSDAFDLLAALEMTPGNIGDTVPADSEGDIGFDSNWAFRVINKALDDGGWPEALRLILTGNVYVGDVSNPPNSTMIYARRDQLLTVLLDIADAEFPGVANVFISKTGKVVFHGRYARFDPTNPDWGINFWPAGDTAACEADPTLAPISGLSFRRSKDDIINQALCLPQLTGEWTLAELSTAITKDTTSIGKYGWRSISYDNLWTLNGRTSPYSTVFPVSALDETKLYSDYYVQNYKDPRTRVSQLSFRPRDPDDPLAGPLWGLMCGVEIGDVIQLKTSHPGGGGFDEDFYVEGIRYNAAPMGADFPEVTLDLDVSPRSLYDFNPFA